MPLKFINTLTREKEEFKPQSPGQVTLYACGVTVYDESHIGHVRGSMVFDVLRRILEHKGLQVTYVRNITDVDDKIIDKARTEIDSGAADSEDLKKVSQQVAARYEKSFQEDFKNLGLRPPDQEPRATEFIPKMIDFIQGLLDKGVAYVGSDGSVYFSVRTLQKQLEKEGRRYGQLSHQDIDQLEWGIRVESGAGKKDPLDFALWKMAKEGEPSWESPWGPGRPGWHIECSTMSTALLGDTFDIHGGGQDLVFPHHENELAQALGAGKPFARVWLHNGLLTVNGQKMSKSLGNFVTIGSVLEKHPNPDILRLFFLSAHYRSPIDFTWERLEEAASSCGRFKAFLDTVKWSLADEQEEEPSEAAIEAEKKFYEAMDDDLNTPEALSALFKLVTKALSWLHWGPLNEHEYRDLERKSGKLSITLDEMKHRRKWLVHASRLIRELSSLLGLTFDTELPPTEVQKLAEQRERARQQKKFQEADEIRQKLMGMGWILEDTGGKTLVRKRV